MEINLVGKREIIYKSLKDTVLMRKFEPGQVSSRFGLSGTTNRPCPLQGKEGITPQNWRNCKRKGIMTAVKS